MLAEVLEVLRVDLEQFLRRKAALGPSRDVVQLVNFASGRDQLAIPADTVGMCLFNIDEERIMKSPGLIPNRNGGRVTMVQPEVRLSLYLLFAANWRVYSEAVKFIGWTVGFFQGKRVFNRGNTPSMTADMSELAVDLYAMTLEQQNYLWAMMGIRYLPSVAYQVRPVVIQESQTEFEQVPVLEIDIEAARTP